MINISIRSCIPIGFEHVVVQIRSAWIPFVRRRFDVYAILVVPTEHSSKRMGMASFHDDLFPSEWDVFGRISQWFVDTRWMQNIAVPNFWSKFLRCGPSTNELPGPKIQKFSCADSGAWKSFYLPNILYTDWLYYPGLISSQLNFFVSVYLTTSVSHMRLEYCRISPLVFYPSGLKSYTWRRAERNLSEYLISIFRLSEYILLNVFTSLCKPNVSWNERTMKKIFSLLLIIKHSIRRKVHFHQNGFYCWKWKTNRAKGRLSLHSNRKNNES